MKRTGTIVAVHVKPGSKSPGITREGGHLTVRVREPAREGKANEACRRALAKEFDVPPSAVRLARGAASKQKLFVIEQ